MSQRTEAWVSTLVRKKTEGGAERHNARATKGAGPRHGVANKLTNRSSSGQIRELAQATPRRKEGSVESGDGHAQGGRRHKEAGATRLDSPVGLLRGQGVREEANPASARQRGVSSPETEGRKSTVCISLPLLVAPAYEKPRLPLNSFRRGPRAVLGVLGRLRPCVLQLCEQVREEAGIGGSSALPILPPQPAPAIMLWPESRSSSPSGALLSRATPRQPAHPYSGTATRLWESATGPLESVSAPGANGGISYHPLLRLHHF
ncbi:hypothetical protein SKAU_G00317170 [Synaphobranchus kaupii]|uniref:Uncharacterized protein n=1 Tax=Synaphobranchus kaupii TaxID=118154 RepID=A0A9Q1ET18_SYNKA|nr:hypothetical protein SKAU_G00317170 [Synaphobranchus kaupii]